MSIELYNEAGMDGINESMLLDVARYALDCLDIHPSAELVIGLIDEAQIAELHVKWMGLSGPTDVMSFPMDECTPGSGRPDAAQPGPAMLGDIVLCPQFAARQADKAGHDLPHELALLTVHGCLHLLGYDHESPEEEKEMFALQNTILSKWYDHCEQTGADYPPRPLGAGAFPDAAQRRDLDDQLAAAEGIPAIGEPSTNRPTEP